jgi:hypothetical protein
MSYRERATTDLHNVIRGVDERQRQQNATVTDGPRSFGKDAYVARGPAAIESTDATYSGEPSGDPYFVILTATANLEAGRLYRVEGLVVVSPHATATVDTDYRVKVAVDVDAAGTAIGDGVTDWTEFAHWQERFHTVSQAKVADPHHPCYAPAADGEITFWLIVEAGLEPTGFLDSQLVVLDVGRSTIPDVSAI